MASMLGLCSTCLSLDRNVRPINNFKDKSIFVDWLDTFNMDNMKICWECQAIFLKINKFKTQVQNAQKMYAAMENKKTKLIMPLSNLSFHTKNTYDIMFEEFDQTYINIHPRLAEVSTNTDTSNNPDSMTPNIWHIEDKDVSLISATGTNVGPNLKTEVKEECNLDTDIADIGINIDENDLNIGYNSIHIKEDSDVEIDLGTNTSIQKESSAPISLLSCLLRTSVPPPIKLIDIDIGTPGPKSIKSHQKDLDKPELNATEEFFTVVQLLEEDMLAMREVHRSGAKFENFTYKCHTCIKGYFKKDQYDRHNKKHSTEAGPYICPVCDVHFVREGNLNSHINSHYRIYKCKRCKFEHDKRKIMKKHYFKEHDGDNERSCRFNSMMENDTDDSHEEQKRKRQINDITDDKKLEEERNLKNKEKCKRYREKKKNKNEVADPSISSRVSTPPISSSSDSEEKKREEERKRKVREKSKRYREKKRKKKEIELAALSMATADSSGTKIKPAKQKK